MTRRGDHRAAAWDSATAVVAASSRDGLPPGAAAVTIAFDLPVAASGHEADVVMPGAPAATAYNIAALRVTSDRLVLLAPEARLPLPTDALAEAPVVALGPAGPPLGRTARDVGRLARRTSQVHGVVVDRSLFVSVGGLDETLANAGEELPVAFADLVLRLTERGVRVRLQPLCAPGEGGGEAGLAAGWLLRKVGARRRRATALVAAIDVAAHSALPAALKRLGVPIDRELKGHALPGLVAGLRAAAPDGRDPEPAELPVKTRAALREAGVVQLIRVPAGSGPRRVELDAVNRDGLACLRVRIDHVALPGQGGTLRAREHWRRLGAWQGSWTPSLLAIEAHGEGLVTVESLHLPIAGAHPTLAFTEAARFLTERRREQGPPVNVDDDRLRGLTRVARELGGEALGRHVDPAVERLASCPALPEHGALQPRHVLICPGRTLLAGWERFVAAGLPGSDAVALGVAALGPEVDAVDALATRATLPMLEPLWTEIAELRLADRADDVILLGLLTLAAAEHAAAAALVPNTPQLQRAALDAWVSR